MSSRDRLPAYPLTAWEMSQQVLPGDVVHVYRPGIVSAAIKRATRSRGESPTESTHTEMVTQSGSIGGRGHNSALIVGATWGGVREARLSEELDDGVTCFSISRPNNLTRPKRLKLVKGLRARIGQRYGYLKLLPHLVDGLLFDGRFVTRRLFFLDRQPVCSYYVAVECSAIGWHFGVPAESATPDDIRDFCLLETHHTHPFGTEMRRFAHG